VRSQFTTKRLVMPVRSAAAFCLCALAAWDDEDKPEVKLDSWEDEDKPAAGEVMLAARTIARLDGTRVSL
jgi:hypothetical protein